MRRAGAATVLLLITTSACSIGQDPPRFPLAPVAPVAEEASPATTLVEPAWQVELDLVSHPAVADGVALVLTKETDGAVRIRGLDVEDGTELWAQPWSPGHVPPGYSLTARAFEDAEGNGFAVFSDPRQTRPGTNFTEPIVAVDVRSGEEIFRTPALRLNTPVAPCDDGIDACFTRDTTSVRLSLTDGTTSPDGFGSPGDARTIGEAGLFSTNFRPGEEVGVRRDGEVLWSVGVEDLLAPTVSSDTGWTFDWDRDEDYYVGWMRAAMDSDARASLFANEPFEQPADMQVLVAFDGATGELLWQTEGANHTCLGHGALAPSDSAPLARCLLGGTIQYGTDGLPRSATDASVILEGMDPRTGAATWSFELPGRIATRVLTNRHSSPTTDGSELLLPLTGGAVLIDLNSGEQTEVGEDAVFACTAGGGSFRYPVAWTHPDRAPVHTRQGDGHSFPCRPDGRMVDSFSVTAIRGGGQDAGEGRYVVSRDGVIEGYHLE